MTFFIQLVVNGTILGVLYALLALGFVLIAKGSGVLNLAQGELVLLGGYLTAWLIGSFGLPVYVGVPLAMLAMVGVGLLVERFVIRPLANQSLLALLVATLALATIIQGAVPMFWGSAARQIELPSGDRTAAIAGLRVPVVNLVSMTVAALALIAIALFFNRSRFGIAMQAASDDRLAAAALGIRIRRVNAVAWAIAGATAAFGGFAWGAVLGVDPSLSLIGLFVFPVVILGGIESLAGVVIGGVVVGIAENLATGYVDPHVGGGFGLVAPLLLLILILLVRPHGLFGRSEIGRV
jgi:branched-chain amino acid transport system permease protein